MYGHLKFYKRLVDTLAIKEHFDDSALPYSLPSEIPDTMIATKVGVVPHQLRHLIGLQMRLDEEFIELESLHDLRSEACLLASNAAVELIYLIFEEMHPSVFSSPTIGFQILSDWTLYAVEQKRKVGKRKRVSPAHVLH